jgi:hypothetical protein
MLSRRSHRTRRTGRLPAFLRRHAARAAGRHAPMRSARLQFEPLEPRLAMAGVVINEFLALNTNGIGDEDDDRSDWIELRNTDPEPVNVGGWFLADSEEQWQLPSVTIAAGDYLLVFASGKDRAVAGQELHTNFNLSSDGERLALLMPDGTTVVDEFNPFPPQVADVSYGRGAGGVIVEPLVGITEAVQVHVPANGNLGTTWTNTSFVPDASWSPGDSPIGYEQSPPGVQPDYRDYFEFNVDPLMSPTQDTIYMRVPFSVANINELQNLTLGMLYDDGFVAYLNGQKIAERNAPASPQWNSSASGIHNDNAAIIYEPIEINQHLDALIDGPNVLAIHGLNFAPTNRNDFLIGPALIAERVTEGVEGFMATPSPGGANQQGSLGVVADTNFSVDRGFFNSAFPVEITTTTADAQVRYTLDGSEPTATHGFIYNAASPPVISTTTTLRAAAFRTGWTPTNIDTQTYIFLDDVLQQDGSNLPPYAPWSHFVNFGLADADWAMDPDIVNDPLYSATIKNDLQAVDSVSVVMPWDELFGAGGIYISGQNIERPGSVELISPGGDQFQIDGAVEIMGGTSVNRWNNDKLSFRVTFKQPYGPTDLDFPLFTDPVFDASAVDEFDTFILDAIYNHSWSYGGFSTPQQQRDTAKFIHDQYVADLQNLAGGQAPHGRYIHLYLNGLYWGLYYLHERPDEDFAASYLGGDADDYDVLKHNLNFANVVSGDPLTTYNGLLSLVRQTMTVPANYQAVEQILDIEELIDYLIIHYYVGNEDWSHQNWYATYNRVDVNGKWRFHSWDSEHVLENLGYNAIFNGPFTNGPEEIHQRLMVNSEYRLKFADRVQELMHNGGLLTPESAAEVWAARTQHVDRAVVGESARWGDNRREPAYTREDWLVTMNDLLSNYFPNRTSIVLGQFDALNWRVPVAAPLMSQYGGTVEAGYQLTLSLPSGTRGIPIYYTLDGTDPRDPATNLPKAGALLYTGPITINAGTEVSARLFVNSELNSVDEWSPLVQKKFFLPTPFPLRITELHYNPGPRAGVAEPQDMEFIELTNTGSETINLAGVQITQFNATPYVFSSRNLGPGQSIVVPRSVSVFQTVYGTDLNMTTTAYAGNLSNGGERIALVGPLGEILQDFVFDEEPPWPTSPDAGGYSLVIIDPLGDPTDPANWRASLHLGGSPGGADVAVPGDYDRNGAVENADWSTWRTSFGNTSAPSAGADGNGDGVVDAADYVVWRKHRSAQMAATAVVAVTAEPNLLEAASHSSIASAVVAEPLPRATAFDRGVSQLRSLARVRVHNVFHNVSRSASAASNPALIDALHEALDHGGRSGNPPGTISIVSTVRNADESPAVLDQLVALWEDDSWLDALGTPLV